MLARPVHRCVALAVVLAAGCGFDTRPVGGPADDSHPVPGGRWPPTTADRWPSFAQSLRYDGCVAYDGIGVRTSIQTPVVSSVQSVSVLDGRGAPFIVINPSVASLPEEVRSFLYHHECAHHHLQHPALREAGRFVDPVLAEYDANCSAGVRLVSTGAFSRQDVDFLLLVLENNSGPDRPPGQAGALVECLRARGLY